MSELAQTFYRYFPVSERDRKWGLHVTTLGEAKTLPASTYPPAGHPEGYAFEWERGRILKEHQLVYISRGQGQFESEVSQPQPIESGDIILLFPGVWHRYRPSSETGWIEHWVGFEGDFVHNWMKHGFFGAKNPVIKATQEVTVLGLFTEALEAIKSDLPALQQILAGTTSHLLGLIFSAQQTERVGGDQSLAMIQTAVQYMRTNLAERVDMLSLAKKLKISYSAFRHTFAEHTGMSPLQYLLELRMALARTLLAETNLPIKAVAEKTGFKDEYYFSRHFRRRTGRTPSEWRSSSRRA